MIPFRTAVSLGFFALMLTASPAVAFDACKDKASYTPLEKRYTKGLLFKIEKCNSPVSYIFGTVHLSRPEIIASAADAFETMKKVDVAGFELGDPGDQIAGELAKTAFKPPKDGKTLYDLIGKDYFSRLVNELKFMAIIKGKVIKSETLNHFRPWVVSVFLQVMDEDIGMVLDEQLWTAATLAGKPVFGLETVEEQEKVFSNLADNLQIRLLKEEIDNYPQLLTAKSKMIQAYLDKDINKLMALEEQTATDDKDPELDNEIRDRLLVKRNKNMVERLEPRLAKQSVMVSVGSLHLPGKDGVLYLLEQDGYFITPMP